MSLTQMLFVPTILFMIFVAPVWVVMHYQSKRKMEKGISPEERENLDYMLATMDKLGERVETLESILSDNHSDWRKNDRPPSFSRGASAASGNREINKEINMEKISMARHHSRTYRDYFEERREGYGKNLYRNTRDGKVGGVCAGLADHFGIAHWVMRIIFIAAFMFTGGVIFWIYLICWIAFAAAPKNAREAGKAYEYDEREHCYRKKNVFRYQAATGERIQAARERLDEINRRVQTMEEYVTSRKFKLDEEFAKL